MYATYGWIKMNIKTEWWAAGVVICLERGADLHMAQLMPLPLTFSYFSKIQIDFTFLAPAHLGSPGQRAVKRVCVCVQLLSIKHGNLAANYYRLTRPSTCVLFLQPRHSKLLLRRLATAIRPQRLQTWTRYGSLISNSRSRRNCAAPCAIWQSRSISPNRRPPSLITQMHACRSTHSLTLTFSPPHLSTLHFVPAVSSRKHHKETTELTGERHKYPHKRDDTVAENWAKN